MACGRGLSRVWSTRDPPTPGWAFCAWEGAPVHRDCSMLLIMGDPPSGQHLHSWMGCGAPRTPPQDSREA